MINHTNTKQHTKSTINNSNTSEISKRNHWGTTATTTNNITNRTRNTKTANTNQRNTTQVKTNYKTKHKTLTTNTAL
eukprot:8674700-Pyramimonas_sp.AAC.1